jgi:hypothetical protein
MSKISRLEEIANEQRKALTTKNTFNGDSAGSEYSSTHSRALSDEETPIHGKGTGAEFDVNNGGGMYDIKGDGKTPGSGREGNLKFNQYKKGDTYTRPDISNIGDILY